MFLSRDRVEADFFVRIGLRRFAAVDLWEVTLDEPGSIEASGNTGSFCEFDGFLCWMDAVPNSQLRLAEPDVQPLAEPNSITQSLAAPCGTEP